MRSAKDHKTEGDWILFVERKAERVRDDRAGLQDIPVFFYLIDINEYDFS